MLKHKLEIPIAKPLLGEEELSAIKRPILSGWLTQGPEVEAFEQEFAKVVVAKHACAVSSCTTALHLALSVAGVSSGDEVITVSHSFIATANSIRYCGAKPVFVDIHAGTYNMDPAKIEKAITSKTKAILCVHQMGMPCDLKPIIEIARRHSLIVIEDAACAIGSEILWNGNWEKIGKPHGDLACFSFHPRKVLTTGDGGMITTSNSEWDKKLRLLRQHGMSVSDKARHASHEVIFESYPVLGYNYRMTDLQAALGREQLKRLPEIISRRRRLAARYQLLLSKVRELTLPEETFWARSNWQSYCVRLSESFDQRQVMQALLAQGISTRRGIMCIHREEAYRSADDFHLTESESAQDHGILLPLYPQMTEEEQDYVCEALIESVKTGGRK